jgi:hypothetical protein
MKMFSAIIVSGALLMATAYTLRSHAAGAFEPQVASALASGTPWIAYSGAMGGAVHSTQQCAGDYICDEYDAWMAIGIDE